MPGAAKVQCMGFCRPVWCLCFPRKFLKVQCLESGQWEEGHCVPVVCKPPPPVFEGMYNCTQGFELDSQCVLNCEQQGQQVSVWGEADVDLSLCFRVSTVQRGPATVSPISKAKNPFTTKKQTLYKLKAVLARPHR